MKNQNGNETTAKNNNGRKRLVHGEGNLITISEKLKSNPRTRSVVYLFMNQTMCDKRIAMMKFEVFGFDAGKYHGELLRLALTHKRFYKMWLKYPECVLESGTSTINSNDSSNDMSLTTFRDYMVQRKADTICDAAWLS